MLQSRLTRRDALVGASSLLSHAALAAGEKPLLPLIVGFEGTLPGDRGVELVINQINDGRAVGAIFFDRNIQSPKQIQILTKHFRVSTKRDVILCLDEEGGRVQRLSPSKGFRRIPSAEEVGTVQDIRKIHVIYRQLAEQVSNAGFNCNLGPVVDLKIGTSSGIGNLKRSFGSDPSLVSEIANVFCAEHRGLGIATCLKHFPGHGSAIADTHSRIVSIDATWNADELIPFDNVEANSVMFSHLHHQKWSSSSGLPISLSREAVSFFRKEFSDEMLIWTDDLQMGAIQKNFNTFEATKKAISAGIDLIIIGNVLKREFELPNLIDPKLIKDSSNRSSRLNSFFNKLTVRI